jgi:protein-S-isoprenylcysteine O-methyltransferase Ste14
METAAKLWGQVLHDNIHMNSLIVQCDCDLSRHMRIPRLPPLLLALVLTISMLALDWALPLFRVLPPPVTYLGAAPVVLGVLIVLISAGLFKFRKTTINPFGEPAVLVQDGFYRFSRNPMYLGMLLVLTGVGLWLGNVPALLLAPAFVVIMTRAHIVREEQLLEDRFGDVYRAYRSRVRRWL